MARPRKNAARVQSALLTPDNVVEIPVEEQPYPLPEGWRWVRLEKLYQINPKIIADDDMLVSFVPMEKIDPGMKGTFTFEVLPWGKAKKGHTQFADGDVAFAKISPCFENGKSMFVQGLKNGIGAGTTELIILRQPNVLQKYTFYLICSSDFIQKGTHTYSGTVGQQRISMDFVRNYPIPLPSIGEQQRIVDRIESLFAKLDDAKAKAEAMLDGFEIRKAAILHKAFTGELTHAIPSNFLPITNFISKEKNSIKAGPFGSALKKDFYVSSGYKIYGQEQVISGDENFGDYFINEEKYQELKSCKVTPGDVLISLVGTVGKILILSDKCKPGIINPRLIKVTFDKKKMTQKFFKYYFQSDEVKASYRERSHGTTMDVMNMSILKQLNFPCFTITEQQEIVSILDNLLAREQQAKEAAETVLHQIDLMKKAILAKAFRGELGTHIAD